MKRDNIFKYANTLKILKDNEVDFVVLARYMQILSSQLIEEYPHQIINIHHSFLPAFPKQGAHSWAEEKDRRWRAEIREEAECEACCMSKQENSCIDMDRVQCLVQQMNSAKSGILQRAIHQKHSGYYF